MISVPDAATLPITGRPVACENASITSAGKSRGAGGRGAGVPAPTGSRGRVVVSARGRGRGGRRGAGGGAGGGGPPGRGVVWRGRGPAIPGPSGPPGGRAQL